MFSRTDTSLLGQWWWTIDRWFLATVVVLMMIGVVLVFAASPGVAVLIKLQSFYFVQRHLIYLIPAFGILVGTSLLPLGGLKKLSFFIFIVGCLALVLVPFCGSEIKGARRWLSFGFFSFQPSEFVKPAFAVVSAWFFAEQKKDGDFPGNLVGGCAYGIFVLLLLIQPDFGMTFLVSVVWFGQFFLAGLRLFWIASGFVMGSIGVAGAYLFLPHVTKRVDRFFSAESVDRYGEGYQIAQSLEALSRGGLLGQGPGEGVVKKTLPDAHSDFIFAVAAEEFGLVLCLLILVLFALIVLRGLSRILKEQDFFVILAVSGVLAQFGIQAMINMASTLHLIPTKGMTLPLISYGGSSIMASCLALGMVLGLTRRRVFVK